MPNMPMSAPAAGASAPASFSDLFGVLPDDHVVVFPFSGERNIIAELQPTFVVLYDLDLEILRRVEIYKSLSRGVPIRMYSLAYPDTSLETKLFYNTLQRENKAFQFLEREARNMLHTNTDVPEQSAEYPGFESVGMLEPPTLLPKPSEDAPGSIVVDTREFMGAPLPNMLHLRGPFEIIPLMLEVGDYILTPHICVERKSYSDLVQSLQEGRLYTQMTAMCKLYQHPILLIEFEEGQPFCFSSPLDSAAQETSVIFRLTTLTIAFPQLRILWSRDAVRTVELFRELKRGHAQPEPAVIRLREATAEDSVGNVAAVEILKKMPGVGVANSAKVMARVESLSALVQVPLEDLIQLLGHNDAAKLFRFIHR
jgi:DNA excision repair protein ERCC-4